MRGKEPPVTVDDGAEQRREALAVQQVYGKLLLQQNHDNIAVTAGHRQVHR